MFLYNLQLTFKNGHEPATALRIAYLKPTLPHNSFKGGNISENSRKFCFKLTTFTSFLKEK